MDNEQPALQHAETDGTGPVKRRRPALSCVECRKRKVKCDRGKPCGPCTRTKSPTCTYRPHPRASERVNGVLANPAPGTNDSQDSGSSMRSTPKSPVQAGIDTMADRYIAPGVFTTPAKDKLSPVPASLRSCGEKDSVTDLSNQMKDLERRLAALTGPRVDGRESRALRWADTAVAHSDGQFIKSKFFGKSHWQNCLEPYDALGKSAIHVNPHTNRTEINKNSELYSTVAECKRMARTIKASRMLQPSVSEEVQHSVPPKNICDQLVQNYLRTFEGPFRILHIPTFLKEYNGYWSNTAVTKPSIFLKTILVCAIGVPFYIGPEQPRLRASSTKWIQAAEAWLSAPHEKSRLNMAGLQIQILLLLARQICSVDGDLVWIPAGTLLRSAMHLGLHRDPSHFGKISVFHKEMRRRLWATILEITVQSSLDMGMPPMISPQDYDTLPPGNFNDDDISDIEPTTEAKPAGEFTECSVQIAFCATLPLRLEIARHINGLRFTLSYDDTLLLGSKLLASCREKTSFLQSFLESPSELKPNPFQIKLFDTLIRRFFLCLHRPFFARAKDEPKYYYSRKICLDTSVAIFSPASQLAEGEDDDWLRFGYRSVGFVKSFFLHSLSTVYIELVAQLEEQQDLVSLVPLTGGSTSTARAALPPQLHVYYQMLAESARISKRRMENGETNAKGYVWLSAALARIDAILAGADVDAAVLAASKAAVSETAEIMRAAYRAENGVDINLSPPRGPFAGKDHGRGDCADDLTGTPHAHDHDWSNFAGAREGGMGAVGGAAEDMDWERLMRDETLDFGWGFEGSPESWFGGAFDDIMGM